MYRTIQKDDINVRKIKTHKNWDLTDTNFEKYFGIEGPGFRTEPFDKLSDLKSNGVYSRLLYSNIKTKYYYNPTTGSALDPGTRISHGSLDERVLGDEIIVFSIDRDVYGEGIKKGSLELTDYSSSFTFTDDSYSNLRYGDEIYGNIFYEHGLVVMTKNITSASYENVNLKFKSTHTIYEHEIFITIPEGEANFTTNPSACTYIDGEPYVKQNFISLTDPSISGSFDDYFTIGLSDPTGSYLRPYITTIGLYDDFYNLVAVAKLARPVKKLPDFPISFMIRFDM